MTRPATRSITASTTTTTEVIDLTKKAAGGQFRAPHTIYINMCLRRSPSQDFTHHYHHHHKCSNLNIFYH
ncbi:unnamed protein product [Fusarium graminearum]|nr:unnamed protein product [Fusarium graminearum]CAG1974681.1 unnamed protein product [Fusarium graminearum]CZS82984.1 unnamed protein product [Fusarium graminearum]